MWGKLGGILGAKFSRKDDLSRQLEIVKVFDLYRQELEKFLPDLDVELVSLKNKTLKVRVTSPVMANELRMREGEILRQINKSFGRDVVGRVAYRF